MIDQPHGLVAGAPGRQVEERQEKALEKASATLYYTIILDDTILYYLYYTILYYDIICYTRPAPPSRSRTRTSCGSPVIILIVIVIVIVDGNMHNVPLYIVAQGRSGSNSVRG